MFYLTNDLTGTIHLIASLLAIVFGTIILIQVKGTRVHRQVGYAYVFAMSVLLITAFMLYHLFGRFHIFHIAAVVSSLTLLFGMYPVIRRTSKQWLMQHLSFMYWSVLGLYAAFWSELFTRIIPYSFFWLVGLATFLTIGTGAWYFRKIKAHWQTKSI